MDEPIAELESRYVAAGGWRAHVRVGERAAAPPVVLVHGLVISSLYMVPTARRLAPYFRVYAPDLPGFGLSDRPRPVLSVPEHAEWLAGWMGAMGLPRAAFVGNSFGCQVIAHLAAGRPELVSAAVLAGPTIDPHARSAPRQIGRWLVDWTLERPSLAPAHVRDYWQAGIPRALATFRLSLEDRIEEQLPRVQAPTLVVRGPRPHRPRVLGARGGRPPPPRPLRGGARRPALRQLHHPRPLRPPGPRVSGGVRVSASRS